MGAAYASPGGPLHKASTFIVCLAVCALITQVQASDAGAKNLALQLLEISDAESNLTRLGEQIGKMLEAQMDAVEMPDVAREKALAHQKKVLDLVYASTFSRDELQGLIDFYGGPTGRAFVEKMPLMTSRMMELAQARMQDISPAIRQMTMEFLEEVKREAQTSPDADEPGE
jgi:hypothetical protein